MKALFERHYDYYEWDDFVIASEDYNKLKEYYLKMKNNYDFPLIENSQQDEYREKEQGHYCIVDIDVI